jgi:ATP-binding cassette subfamily B protein
MIFVGDGVQAFADSHFEQLTYYSLSVLLLGISGAVLILVSNVLRELLAQRMERDGRNEFYLNLLGKSQSFHDQQKIGDIMSRTASDVRMLNFLISPALSLILESVINTLVPLIFIGILFPAQMLLVPILFVVTFVIAVKKYSKSLAPVTDILRKSFGDMNAMMTESLTGIEVVKAFVKEEHERSKYLKFAEKYRDALEKEGSIQAKYIPYLLIAFAITGGLVHGIILNRMSLLLVGQIISYVGLLMNLQRPTRISIWAYAIVQEAVSSSQRLIEFMVKKSTIGQNLQGVKREIEGLLEFSHVNFHYPESNREILKDINFQIPAGKTVAIVGTTGSGKTTLTKLIARLYDVTSGEIRIDNVPIKNYALQSLRSQISFIEQDVFLFSTTIYENISFGRKCTNEEVIQAAKDAQAHEFIMQLPNQYQTKLGEQGVQLSGGERQRIAIARAFLVNPKILVLDDSTSAIDSQTEEKIQIAMKNVVKNRTTFLITHRLSQIRWADKIIVLKKGIIIAEGTHKELLKNCEEYQKIFIKRFDLTLEQLMGEGD